MVQDAVIMKVGVVGLGYVGLVTASVLAENGNSIVVRSSVKPVKGSWMDRVENRFYISDS